MDERRAAEQRLVDMCLPLWRNQDREGLLWVLEADWSPECLALLSDSDDPEVAETAAAGLGVIGDMSYCAVLAKLLHHADAHVAAAAEDGLWSIWFRDGGALGQSALHRISEDIRRGQTENVVPLLNELIRIKPRYAEAYHQRSQTHYLAGDYPATLRDARHTLALNPFHFGAMTNEGHALSALGRWHDAQEVYRRVLQLHPRMPGIRETLQRLRERLAPVGV